MNRKVKSKKVNLLNKILSITLLVMIEFTTNMNQLIFEAISFMFEEPNLKIIKPLVVAIFIVVEWIGLHHLLEKIVK